MGISNLEGLETKLTDLATHYNKPIVVEYKEHKKEVNESVKNLPNGFDSFIWEAASPCWGDLFDQDGAANENIQIYHDFYTNYKK